ncbi:hypothetical protein [Pseudorhodoferax sp.]|uniref:hypothetical protein n=1 Tax=Pseudorhodoferax sp. TaxID=1993553 RepID=UPI002DD663CB|nr:hypothetical protein [Pseudorhodoferax sp.]
MTTSQPPKEEAYRPTSGRQRLFILAAAIVMACVVVVVMLGPQVRFMRADKARKAAGPPACSGTQTDGCVGGTMGVIAAPASAPR